MLGRLVFERYAIANEGRAKDRERNEQRKLLKENGKKDGKRESKGVVPGRCTPAMRHGS